MHCPVCDNATAEDISPLIFDGRTFRCPKCGEFNIVSSVYDVGGLKALDFIRAKRRPGSGPSFTPLLGKRPRITTYDL